MSHFGVCHVCLDFVTLESSLCSSFIFVQLIDIIYLQHFGLLSPVQVDVNVAICIPSMLNFLLLLQVVCLSRNIPVMLYEVLIDLDLFSDVVPFSFLLCFKRAILYLYLMGGKL